MISGREVSLETNHGEYSIILWGVMNSLGAFVPMEWQAVFYPNETNTNSEEPEEQEIGTWTITSLHQLEDALAIAKGACRAHMASLEV